MTVTWRENDTVILCLECTPTVIEDGTVEESTNTKGHGRRERNDEGEWGRIPIPQSDDSDSTEGWLSDESDQGEINPTTNKSNTMNYRNCFIAFLVASHKDGRILAKDGTIIDVNERPQNEVTQEDLTLNDELPVTKEAYTRPHWTQHLMAFQRDQLKKGYRIKTTQRSAKLMRQIRRTPQHALKERNKRLKHNKKTRAIDYGYTQYDIARAYI